MTMLRLGYLRGRRRKAVRVGPSRPGRHHVGWDSGGPFAHLAEGRRPDARREENKGQQATHSEVNYRSQAIEMK